jgi:hypothetical protein
MTNAASASVARCASVVTGRGRAVTTVEYDASTLDLLVRHRYLDDKQASNKRLVGKAISQLLRGVEEPPTPKKLLKPDYSGPHRPGYHGS